MKLPVYRKHISLGAKMHEFQDICLSRPGIIDEHLAVCQGVGVSDVPHWENLGESIPMLGLLRRK